MGKLKVVVRHERGMIGRITSYIISNFVLKFLSRNFPSDILFPLASVKRVNLLVSIIAS